MKRLTVLALANALLLIVLTSGAANAQFNLVHTAMIDGFFVSGTSGTLQSTLSGTQNWGVGTYTTKEFTQVVLNGVPTKTDPTPGSFVVQP